MKFHGLVLSAFLIVAIGGTACTHWDNRNLLEAKELYVRQNYLQALILFKQLAEKGNPEAQYYLGGMYCFGKGCPKDTTMAFYWYEKAAGQGWAQAQYNLFIMLYEGTEVRQNQEKALAWLKKAAENGLASAQIDLSACYYAGMGDCRQDYGQSVRWLERAAGQGDAGAQFRLGLLFFRGNQVIRQNWEAAFGYFTKAAEQKRADAEYYLGIMCYYGLGTERNREQGIAWLTKSAEGGFVLAKGALGYWYYLKALQSEQQAARWLDRKVWQRINIDLDKQQMKRELEKGRAVDEIWLEHFRDGQHFFPMKER